MLHKGGKDHFEVKESKDELLSVDRMVEQNRNKKFALACTSFSLNWMYEYVYVKNW